MTKPMTVWLTDEQDVFLRQVAEREQVTAEVVLSEIIQRKLDYDEWFVRAVQAGIDQADRGEFVTVRRDLIAPC